MLGLKVYCGVSLLLHAFQQHAGTLSTVISFSHSGDNTKKSSCNIQSAWESCAQVLARSWEATASWESFLIAGALNSAYTGALY